MIQTGLIKHAHADLVTDAAYDFYGLRLATCGLDQKIKVWQTDQATGQWTLEQEWRAHDAAVSKLSWAHPEFGSILASASYDRIVKVWERRSANVSTQEHGSIISTLHSGTNGLELSDDGTLGGISRLKTKWVEMSLLPEAKGTVRAVEFSPHHFGLKLASISTDHHLRLYECVDLRTWTLADEVDMLTLPLQSTSSPFASTPTPTHTQNAPDGASVAQALQQAIPRQGVVSGLAPNVSAGNREADGGWCLSWCKERYWGEVLAAGSGVSGVVHVVRFSPSRRTTVLLALNPHPSDLAVPTAGAAPSFGVAGISVVDTAPPKYAITSVAWAPSCGRSYHLIATGSRDGHVRIWRIKPANEGNEEGELSDADGQWEASVVADFNDHRSSVGRVEWNMTGTILSSAGDDGRIRLWRMTSGNVWRAAGNIGVEEAEDNDDIDSSVVGNTKDQAGVRMDE